MGALNELADKDPASAHAAAALKDKLREIHDRLSHQFCETGPTPPSSVARCVSRASTMRTLTGTVVTSRSPSATSFT